MKKHILNIAIALTLLLSTQTTYAQPPGGGGGQGQGGQPPGGNGTGAPVDSGAVCLLLGIALYAFYTYKEQPAIKISTVTPPATTGK